MSKMLTVYATDGSGVTRTDTIANCRDHVNSGLYSWDPQGRTNPADHAPKAVRPKVRPTKSLAQEVLDGVAPQAGTLDTNPSGFDPATGTLASDYADEPETPAIPEVADEADEPVDEE